MGLSEVRRGFETNFFGPMRLVQLVRPGKRQRKLGCSVNVSSVAGRVATDVQAFYSGSKCALEAASEALAQEVHPLRMLFFASADSAYVTGRPAPEKRDGDRRGAPGIGSYLASLHIALSCSKCCSTALPARVSSRSSTAATMRP